MQKQHNTDFAGVCILPIEHWTYRNTEYTVCKMLLFVFLPRVKKRLQVGGGPEYVSPTLINTNT